MRTPETGPVRAAIAVIAVLIVTASCGPVASAPRDQPKTSAVPHVIIDTDLSLYWDDVTAVGMANVLQQRGKVEILGVMSDIRNTVAVAAIDAIDTAYGHGHIPVGAVADSGANAVPTGYSDALVRRLPHAIRSSTDVPGAVSLYRHLLASQPDHSVTVVAIGADTKVRRLVIEDGLFPGGAPVPFTNSKYDVPSARVVVMDWPTPIAWVDGFTGINTKVGGTLCSTTPADSPMRIVYEALFGCGPPGDGDWDGPTMLYAIGGRQGVFSELGQGGAAAMNAGGGLSWVADSPGRRELYVHVTDQETLNQRIDGLLAAR